MCSSDLESTLYAASSALTIATAEIDKALVFRLSTAADAGLYGLAARVAQAAALPATALTNALIPAMFRAHGARAALRVARGALALGAATSAAGGVVLALGHSWVVPVFGAAFAESADLFLYLAPLPLLLTLRQFTFSAMTAMRRQPTRVVAECVLLAIGVAGLLVFVPKYGRDGAPIALLAAEGAGALVGATWFALRLAGERGVPGT